jgi:uncharacterized membrane protein
MPPNPQRVTSAAMLLVVSIVWVAALVGGPYVVSRSDRDSAGLLAGGAVYALGSVICHQMAHRSFHVAGTQLPVCARCTGLYLLTPVGLALAIGQTRRCRRPLASRLRTVRFVLVAAAVPTAISVGAEAAGVGSWSNLSRAIAAFPLGLAVAWVVGLAACGSLGEPSRLSGGVD